MLRRRNVLRRRFLRASSPIETPGRWRKRPTLTRTSFSTMRRIAGSIAPTPGIDIPPASLLRMQPRACSRILELRARRPLVATMAVPLWRATSHWGPSRPLPSGLGDVFHKGLTLSRHCGDVRRLKLLSPIWCLPIFWRAVGALGVSFRHQ